MTELPTPPIPADCDLQDFAFMPLDVARLRDSDLASDESPEACWAAVLLWAASWHQVPAASIPDNENWIAKQAGYAQRGKIAREWASVRNGALRGWVKCSDGRLYHPVVAEKAKEAWSAKCEQRWRTECGRIKKHNQRHGTKIPTLDYESWTNAGRPQGQPLHVPGDIVGNSGDNGGDNASKRQGEGQGQGDFNNSVPNGTGGSPPKVTDPDEIIFGYGVPLLTAAGSADKDARSFLGKLRKVHGDAAVIDKLRQCLREKPLQPLTWLAAALPPNQPEGKPNRQEALEQRNQEVAARLAAAGEPA